MMTVASFDVCKYVYSYNMYDDLVNFMWRLQESQLRCNVCWKRDLKKVKICSTSSFNEKDVHGRLAVTGPFAKDCID